MACYPWIVPHEKQGQSLADFPNLARWFASIRDRPAVVRAYERAEGVRSAPVVDDEAKKVLFGQGRRRRA